MASGRPSFPTFAIPRRDTKLLARKLLERFGTLARVLEAELPDVLRGRVRAEETLAIPQPGQEWGRLRERVVAPRHVDRRQQVPLIQREGHELPLPEMAAPPFPEVHPLSLAPIGFADGTAQSLSSTHTTPSSAQCRPGSPRRQNTSLATDCPSG